MRSDLSVCCVVLLSLSAALMPTQLSAAPPTICNLGTLGGAFSLALDVNNSGQVVGQSTTTNDAVWHAFLYTGTPGVDGRMIDLDTWLDANNPTEGAKWTLSDAADISDTG